MGIVNVTPDSFSDQGQWATAEAAVAHGHRLLEEGADLLDIGGESTRPGASPVSAAEEIRRVAPVLAALRKDMTIPLSVDTRKADVARAALAAGADLVNDISAGADPGMLPLCRENRAGIVLMHMQGTPPSMQRSPCYRDVLAEVEDFLRARAAAAREQGIPPERIWLDPGIGFGK
mgnify:CR=1 FL=1